MSDQEEETSNQPAREEGSPGEVNETPEEEQDHPYSEEKEDSDHPYTEEKEAPPEADDNLNKQVRIFEKYLEESGLTLAFQTIFAEILTKKIQPANVFTYTSMRLREIGKEIAHLLPQNLTANLGKNK